MSRRNLFIDARVAPEPGFQQMTRGKKCRLHPLDGATVASSDNRRRWMIDAVHVTRLKQENHHV